MTIIIFRTVATYSMFTLQTILAIVLFYTNYSGFFPQTRQLFGLFLKYLKRSIGFSYIYISKKFLTLRVRLKKINISFRYYIV